MMIAMVADRTCGQVRPGDLAHLGHHAVIERDEARADARAIARAAGAAGASGTSDSVSHYLVSLCI